MEMASRLREACERSGVASLYVLGSRASGIASSLRGETIQPLFPASDIDVGVSPGVNLRLVACTRVRSAASLEDAFAVDRVDQVVLPEAEPFLALEVVP